MRLKAETKAMIEATFDLRGQVLRQDVEALLGGIDWLEGKLEETRKVLSLTIQSADVVVEDNTRLGAEVQAKDLTIADRDAIIASLEAIVNDTWAAHKAGLDGRPSPLEEEQVNLICDQDEIILDLRALLAGVRRQKDELSGSLCSLADAARGQERA